MNDVDVFERRAARVLRAARIRGEVRRLAEPVVLLALFCASAMISVAGIFAVADIIGGWL